MTRANQIPDVGSTAHGESTIPNACWGAAAMPISGRRTPRGIDPHPPDETPDGDTTVRRAQTALNGRRPSKPEPVRVKAEGVTAGETAPLRGVHVEDCP